jgi:hypothetical protein
MTQDARPKTQGGCLLSPHLGRTLIGGCRGSSPCNRRKAECWGRWIRPRPLGGAGGSSPCSHWRPETEGALCDGAEDACEYRRTVPPSPLRGTPPSGGRDKAGHRYESPVAKCRWPIADARQLPCAGRLAQGAGRTTQAQGFSRHSARLSSMNRRVAIRTSPASPSRRAIGSPNRIWTFAPK